MTITKKSYFTEQAYLPQGWQSNVLITIEHGIISDLKSGLTVEEASRETQKETLEIIDGAVLPGMPNLHSHAFQRALAGFTEHTTGHTDTFWTWRTAMYKLAMSFNPEMLKAVATQLYSEMIQVGYTSVAEFHYIHKPRVHKPDPLAMSQALIEAALATGIRLVLLPVLYQQSDFHHAPPSGGQKHFALSLDDYLTLITKLQADVKNYPTITIGIAPHSIRAVSPEVMKELFSALPTTLRHIHIAEQMKEVNDCLEAYKARPVEWLLDNFDVNEQWCLIHCTHMVKSEIEAFAKSKAVAGLCPTTEGNLGDGFFALREFINQQGCFGIGTDSNSSVSSVEELRFLEYGQRLKFQERNIVAGLQASSGQEIYTRALEGGARALKQPLGKLEVGYAADFIILDTEHPQLVGHKAKTLLDAYIFSGNQNPISKVMVAGKWIDKQDKAQSAFNETMKVIANL